MDQRHNMSPLFIIVSPNDVFVIPYNIQQLKLSVPQKIMQTSENTYMEGINVP